MAAQDIEIVTEQVNKLFFTQTGWYFFFIPIAVPYAEIQQRAEAAGYKVIGEGIYEKPVMIGRTRIGIEIEKAGSKPSPLLQEWKGQFLRYDYTGPYKTLGKAFRAIIRYNRKASNFMLAYLDDPKKVGDANCRTKLYFQIKD